MAMKILLLAAAVAQAFRQDPLPPAVTECSSLLQCCPPEREGHFASLMEDMKGMVQEQVIPLLKTLVCLHDTTQDNSPPRHCMNLLDSGDSESGLRNVFLNLDQSLHNTTQDHSPPRHCKDLLDSGDSESGLRDVFPNPDRPHYSLEVYCEQNVDGGGWIVFQRRTDSTVRQSFERTWDDYKEGFGDKTGEFWVGLDDLHQLTNITQQELRVDLNDFEGGHAWAKYDLFHVGSQDTNYRLTIGSYTGNAGDAMGSNNGTEFSTHDADHDAFSSYNCALRWRGGWWYNDCGYANLNGYQHVGYYTTRYGEGIKWQQWQGWRYSLKRTTMMIRPAV